MQLVDTYGPDQIIAAVDRLSPEEKAQVTVSTAHKAKGREWPSVRIGKGFMAPSVDDHGGASGSDDPSGSDDNSGSGSSGSGSSGSGSGDSHDDD